jgi:hypothetical protein
MNQVHYVEPTGEEQFPDPDQSAIRRHAMEAVTENSDNASCVIVAGDP